MPERFGARSPSSVQARRTAIAKLGQRAEGVGEPGDAGDVALLLYEALADDDFGVRQEAVRLVVRSGPTPYVLDALERALCDESSLARRSSSMEAFGKLGRGGVPSLARLARDERAGVRRLAVDALGLTRAPEAYEVLATCSNDAAPAVRAASLEALSRIDDERALRRVEEVVARRDEHATVVLAGLLGLDARGRVLAPSHIRPHLAEPLTAAPALRLLGRAGDATPLLEVLARGKGARQRAAAVGLANALLASPATARPAIAAARARIEAPLVELCADADISAAAAALIVAASAGVIEVFVVVARRADRGVLVASAHRAAAALAQVSPSVPARLAQLAASEQDSAAAALLDEIAEGVRPSAPAPEVASSRRSQPPAPSPAAPPSLFAVDRPSLDEADFARLSALFHREAGLLFEEHAAWRLEARLAPRFKARECSSWAEYIALLERSGAEGRAELSAALERVTVHETYFFRERHQLDSFADEVLPTVLGGKAPRPLAGLRSLRGGTFRVLSAGCSTGEEAWTIAILLEESGLFGGALDYEVMGIDIAPSIIDAARQARYGRRGFRGDVPPEVMRRWFQEDGKNHVVTGLRDRVSFHVGNLLDAADLARLGHFDIVFCRNVLIYMSDEARAGVIRHLYDRLHPGGVLFLGHSESLLNVESGFRFLPLERELAYLRPLDGARRSP